MTPRTKEILRQFLPPYVVTMARRLREMSALRQPPPVVKPTIAVDPTASSESDLFQRSLDAARGIEGMLSDFSIAVMDMMLSAQERRSSLGHLVEFGVYKGRSAAVLGTHTRVGERLVLVDAYDQFERTLLKAICPRVEFVVAPAEQAASAIDDYPDLCGCCRMIHIDASHQFEPTLKELAIADRLLQNDGLVVLDDYTNLNYSQNIAAIFKYLFTEETSLTPCLVTAEKAYLCKRQEFEFYGKFILENAVSSMALRSIDACIARTDMTPHYRAFHLRPLLPGESGPFYGYEIYKGYYVSP